MLLSLLQIRKERRRDLSNNKPLISGRGWHSSPQSPAIPPSSLQHVVQLHMGHAVEDLHYIIMVLNYEGFSEAHESLIRKEKHIHLTKSSSMKTAYNAPRV